ncbi:MAG: hypothetical protein ACFFAA_07755 [Promethearchaeota archaeon]
MVKRQICNQALIIFIIISFFVSFAGISLNYSQETEYTQHRGEKIPEIAQDPIPYGAISQNISSVYRLFESINFTLNTFDFTGANYTKMQISFTNGSIKEFDMKYIGGDDFLGIYKPPYNAPLGMQNVSFLIYNETNHLLNTHTTYRNFTIYTNYLINLYNSENQLSSEYYINDTIYAELLVSNFKSYNFTWNTTIVNSLDQFVQYDTVNFERDINQFNILLKNETFNRNQFYYVQLNMTDKISGRKETAYYPFYVRNNKPRFISPINVSPEEVFRTEDFTISFNVTDIENKAEDLTPYMTIYDAKGAEVISNNLIDYDSNNLFSETFSIGAGRPVGKYKVNITLIDTNYDFSTKSAYFTVKNNPPEIHSYSINGLNMDQPISIFYSRDLVFSFNVSDIEGVTYVKVALFGENDEWYNITRNYFGENTEITIRTFDLTGELWYVYIYVIDTDGMVIGLTEDYDKAPQAIRIIPDIVGYYLPWILFFGGIIFGLLLGVVIAYTYFKSKGKPQKITTKKKEMQIKKPKKKKMKEVPIKEEPEEEHIGESKPEKIKEEIPQRKIKRKL